MVAIKLTAAVLAAACIAVSGPAAARFLSVDPVQANAGNGQNFNRYWYANNNPYKFTDPDGRETIVIVNNNLPVVGTHSGLMISRDGENLLYDPAGSYRSDTRGTGGAFGGDEANLGEYVRFQKADGARVAVFRFDTTREQEAEIENNIESIGDPRRLSCTTSVSDALDGIGPFRDLGTILTPRGLHDAMVDLKVHETREASKRGLPPGRKPETE